MSERKPGDKRSGAMTPEPMPFVPPEVQHVRDAIMKDMRVKVTRRITYYATSDEALASQLGPSLPNGLFHPRRDVLIEVTTGPTTDMTAPDSEEPPLAPELIARAHAVNLFKDAAHAWFHRPDDVPMVYAIPGNKWRYTKDRGGSWKTHDFEWNAVLDAVLTLEAAKRGGGLHKLRTELQDASRTEQANRVAAGIPNDGDGGPLKPRNNTDDDDAPARQAAALKAAREKDPAARQAEVLRNAHQRNVQRYIDTIAANAGPYYVVSGNGNMMGYRWSKRGARGPYEDRAEACRVAYELDSEKDTSAFAWKCVTAAEFAALPNNS